MVKTTRIKLLASIIISVLTIAILLLLLNKKHQTQAQVIFPNDYAVNVEIANTPLKMSRGLMYRKELPRDQGMLFIFEKVQKHSFWMKNTYIPLDMIWLDEQLTIIDIKPEVQPCKENEQCRSYLPIAPAKYVLEPNAGVAREQGLKFDDTLRFMNIPQ